MKNRTVMKLHRMFSFLLLDKMIPLKLLALFLLLWSGMQASVSINIKKETKTVAINKPSRVTDIVTNETDKDFDSFFKRFSGDSVFQQARIKFPLKVTMIEDEENQVKWIKNKEWVYTDFIHFKSVRLQQERISDKAVKLIFMIEDTGVLIHHYFQKENGKWMLVSIEDYSS